MTSQFSKSEKLEQKILKRESNNENKQYEMLDLNLATIKQNVKISLFDEIFKPNEAFANRGKPIIIVPQTP